MRVLSPRAASLCHSTSVCLWGGRSRRHNNSSKQKQSQPNMFCRNRHRRSAWLFAVLHLFPILHLACQRNFSSFWPSTTPWPAVYLHPPRCSDVVQHPWEIIPKIRRGQRRQNEWGANCNTKNSVLTKYSIVVLAIRQNAPTCMVQWANMYGVCKGWVNLIN